MKKLLFLSGLMFLSMSCGKASADQTSQTKTLEKSQEERTKPTKYIRGDSAAFATKLDQRMSLMPSPKNKDFLVLMDIDGKYTFGLTTTSHYVAGQYTYLEEGKFLKFKIGPFVKETRSAEILDYESDTPIGVVEYAIADYYPTTLNYITDICTGAYEGVCTLSYDKSSDLFSIKLHD